MASFEVTWTLLEVPVTHPWRARNNHQWLAPTLLAVPSLCTKAAACLTLLVEAPEEEARLVHLPRMVEMLGIHLNRPRLRYLILSRQPSITTLSWLSLFSIIARFETQKRISCLLKTINESLAVSTKKASRTSNVRSVRISSRDSL